MSIRLRSGQALVMILLLLSVVITVGLAISSRSVTEVGISTTQEESARALAAAEAGIEAALSGTVAVGSTVNVGTTGSYVVPALTQYGAGPQVTFGEGVKAGEAATVFLLVDAQRYTGSSVVACWGDTTTAGIVPALEAITYYQSGGNYLANRNVYDPQGTGRTPGSAGVDGNTSGCPTDKSYAYKATVSLSSGTPYYLRLKLFYNGDTSSPVGVAGVGSQFPAQGQLVTSTGQAGQTSRRVQVVQRYADLLPYLDNAVFSGGSLVK